MEKILEIILYLICICTISFSQAYTIHFTSKLINKKTYPIKKLLIGFLCFIPISVIGNLIYYNFPELNFLKTLISTLAFILNICLIYRNSLIKTIIITIISLIIPFLFDILVVLIVNVIFNDIDSMNEILKDRKLYYLINILTTLLIIASLKIIDLLISKRTSKNSSISTPDKYTIILYQGLIIIVTLIPSMILMFVNNYNYSLLFVLINTLQLIVVSLFSFFYMKKRILFKETELELENTKLHNQALASINENIRGFKHDMGNIVQSINGYLAVGNIDGVKTYCQNLLHGFNDINLLSILSPKIINDPAIYGIVVGKMLYARKNDLTLSLDIGLDVSQINFPSFELSRIIGILLDNAIEASLESDEKKLKLEMYHDENRNQDVIIIGNSVKNASKIDIRKIFEKNYSTKKNPSGFGLYEVLKFFKKNNKGDIVPNLDYDTNFFTQIVTFDR